MEEEIDPLNALLFRGKGSNVETVMVGGKLLMKDKHLTFVDKDELLEELKKGARKSSPPEHCGDHLFMDELMPYIRNFYQSW